MKVFRSAGLGVLEDWSFWSFLILSLLALPPRSAALTSAPTAGEPDEGAVVEEVTKGLAAESAGIRLGDVILSWSRGDENGGPVRSPFDLGWIEMEQSWHGAVTLRGTRENESREWILSPDESWGIMTRPTLPEDLLAMYRQGRDLIASGELEHGIGCWRSAVEAADRRNDPLRAAGLQDRLAWVLADAGRWPEADTAWEEAVQRLEGSQAAAGAQLLRAWSETFQQRNLWDRAEACYRRALALEPENGISAAYDLVSLGEITSRRGDFAAAEDLFQKAHAIGERLLPGSLELGLSLVSLGDVARMRGDPSAAEERYGQALNLFEKLEQDGMYVAMILTRLAAVNMNRGNFAIAEERFRRALTIQKELAPESPEVAVNLNQLGMLAEKRGDFAAAEEYHRHALDICKKLAPNSPGIGVYYLYNLAAVERRRGDLAKADEHLQHVVEIQSTIEPESYDTARAYYYRALVAIERGNLVLAEEMNGRALAILEKQTPGSIVVSDSLEDLGTIAFKRGDLAKARDLFQRALAIREKMAPGSTQVGLSLHHLGQVDRQEGRLAMAAERFCRATEAFDQQRKKLGGTTEARSAFGGTTAEPYRDCLAALIDIGRPEEAFRVLEQGRARSFLDLLAERDLMWTADLPPELAKERAQTDTEYDRTQAALDRLSPGRDQAEIDRLLVRLRELRTRQEELMAKVRQTSPRAAALQDPRPLELASARAALDPGTVLLAWSIGRERSFLFVVQPEGTEPGFEVFPLPLSDQAMRPRVEAFRNLLQRADSDRAELTRQARELYDALLRPAERRIATARRLLVSPDGPLHTLPFAALVRDGRWLAEQKPIHTVLSATVYAELKKSRHQGSGTAGAVLTAFGDPSYPLLPAGQSSHAHPDVRAAVGRGLSLNSLPSTREEVRSIAKLYPEARTYLGSEATEERAKSIGEDVRYIHFACHGLLDERFPLSSALALSIPENPKEGQENGLLQAWEIFERLRLDADLVTLSACDSALGQEMGGEGLLGLTRAFQYAGARSVLASLWSVSDASTARLMQSFYTYLRRGQTKDGALRAAQVDLIRSRDVSHPYYWAAFQLSGDWK